MLWDRWVRDGGWIESSAFILDKYIVSVRWGALGFLSVFGDRDVLSEVASGRGVDCGGRWASRREAA